MQKFENMSELSQYLAFEALKYTSKNGPTVPAKEVYDYIENHVNNLKIANELKGTYESHTGPKFVIAMNFKLIGPVKAGWLKKSSPKPGYWTITEEGIKIVKSGKSLEDFKKLSHKKYWDWKKSQETNIDVQDNIAVDDVTNIKNTQQTIRAKLLELDPYQFQDLTAGLLEGMGYFIDFNAPRGKDGGIDLVCYRDPIGAEIPRIKVQCKHRPESKISRADVSQFAGVINSDEIGIFVTSGYFTPDSKRYAMERNVHIRLIDGQELEDMWAKYYGNIPEDKKLLLPLKFTPELALEDV
jgi:restriction system protein